MEPMIPSDFYWVLHYDPMAAPPSITRLREVIYLQLHEFDFLMSGQIVDGWTMIVTVNGEPRITHGDKLVTAHRGSVTLITDGEDHRLYAAMWEAFTFRFHPSPAIVAACHYYGVRHGRTWHHVVGDEGLRTFQEIYGYGALPTSVATLRAITLLEHTLLTAIHQSQPVMRPEVMRMQDIVSYVRQHLATPFKVAALARMANVSPSYFAHRFRDEFGTPVQAYFTRLRIERAEALLRTTEIPAAQIGAAVGYPDPHHFYVTFKRLTGMTPGAYRRRFTVHNLSSS